MKKIVLLLGCYLTGLVFAMQLLPVGPAQNVGKGEAEDDNLVIVGRFAIDAFERINDQAQMILQKNVWNISFEDRMVFLIDIVTSEIAGYRREDIYYFKGHPRLPDFPKYLPLALLGKKCKGNVLEFITPDKIILRLKCQSLTIEEIIRNAEQEMDNV